MLVNMDGNLIVITFGLPFVVLFALGLRNKRIDYLLLMGLDKMKTDTDALIQIQTIQGMILNAKTNQIDEVNLIGFINLHIVECQNSECPCKNESELFDVPTGKFSQRNSKSSISKY